MFPSEYNSESNRKWLRKKKGCLCPIPVNQIVAPSEDKDCDIKEIHPTPPPPPKKKWRKKQNACWGLDPENPAEAEDVKTNFCKLKTSQAFVKVLSVPW